MSASPFDRRRLALFRRLTTAGTWVARLGLVLCAVLAFYIFYAMPFAFADEIVIPRWMFVPPVVWVGGLVTFAVGRVGSWLIESA
ncbi:MAG: hypothetical protein ABWZ87_05465 [Aeromicrobium sp.]